MQCLCLREGETNCIGSHCGFGEHGWKLAARKMGLQIVTCLGTRRTPSTQMSCHMSLYIGWMSGAGVFRAFANAIWNPSILRNDLPYPWAWRIGAEEKCRPTRGLKSWKSISGWPIPNRSEYFWNNGQLPDSWRRLQLVEKWFLDASVWQGRWSLHQLSAAFYASANLMRCQAKPCHNAPEQFIHQIQWEEMYSVDPRVARRYIPGYTVHIAWNLGTGQFDSGFGQCPALIFERLSTKPATNMHSPSGSAITNFHCCTASITSIQWWVHLPALGLDIGQDMDAFHEHLMFRSAPVTGRPAPKAGRTLCVQQHAHRRPFLFPGANCTTD